MDTKNTEITKMVFDAGIDVNKQDNYGVTTLMTTNNLLIIRLLILAGADINKKDILGRTALIQAGESPLVLH